MGSGPEWPQKTEEEFLPKEEQGADIN